MYNLTIQIDKKSSFQLGSTNIFGVIKRQVDVVQLESTWEFTIIWKQRIQVVMVPFSFASVCEEIAVTNFDLNLEISYSINGISPFVCDCTTMWYGICAPEKPCRNEHLTALSILFRGYVWM